jgi:hypothetical protein
LSDAVVPVIEVAALVVATGEPTTPIVNCLKVLMFALSVTLIVKEELPAFIGIPEITPVLKFKASPSGSVPADTDHEYGWLPPAATSELEY